MKWDEAVLQLQKPSSSRFQEQYQFVYKRCSAWSALKRMEMAPWQWTETSAALTMGRVADPAETLSRWCGDWNREECAFVNLLKTENFLEAFFCQTLGAGYMITQLLFYTDKTFDIYFLPFYVLMVSYWAFAPLFISHTVKQRFYLVCTIWSVLLPIIWYYSKPWRDIPHHTCYFLIQYSEGLCYDSDSWFFFFNYSLAKAAASSSRQCCPLPQSSPIFKALLSTSVCLLCLIGGWALFSFKE